jgi:hypothetical protein
MSVANINEKLLPSFSGILVLGGWHPRSAANNKETNNKFKFFMVFIFCPKNKPNSVNLDVKRINLRLNN